MQTKELQLSNGLRVTVKPLTLPRLMDMNVLMKKMMTQTANEAVENMMEVTKVLYTALVDENKPTLEAFQEGFTLFNYTAVMQEILENSAPRSEPKVEGEPQPVRLN